MSNSWFRFKQFVVHQDRCAMKVTTDSCLFGAWVAKELQMRPGTGPEQLLDLGAGTGLLSLMIAQANPAFSIEGIEIDKECHDQAAKNAEASIWKNRINIIHGDATSYDYQKKYGVIVSNPPFYNNEWRSANERKNIAHHSGTLSLDDLCTVIKNNLSDSGVFYLLLPYKRKSEMEALLKKKNIAVTKTMYVRQTTKHSYFRIMVAGSLHAGFGALKNEIAIKDEAQQYTPEFIALMKDYYENL